MAIIQSGADTTQWTVDPTSKAGRVTLYDSSGRELQPKQTGSYFTKLEVRCTGAPVAGKVAFNLKGPPTLNAFIRRIRGRVTFDGIALAASGTLRWGWYRGTGSALPTGGTASVISKKKSTMPTSTVADARFDLSGAGLTTTGITYEVDAFEVLGLSIIETLIAAPTTGASPGAVVPFDMQFHQPGDPDSDLIIANNEHLALQVQTVTGIIGFGISGTIEYDER